MAPDEPTVAASATTDGTAATTTVGDAAADAAGTDEGTKDDAGAAGSARDGDSFDLRGIVRQFTAPMIESLDARLREQVEAHADALLDEKVDAAVSDRLATIERAIADLSRSLEGLERRLATLEHADSPLDLE
ncbi:MAG TPA: hypothetical protein VGZ03_02325 [Acidimicrobiales bacterium]|jgi:hypothetical protein|nr:hypothetical protein [Acidimicrobiales bacterium]